MWTLALAIAGALPQDTEIRKTVEAAVRATYETPHSYGLTWTATFEQHPNANFTRKGKGDHRAPFTRFSSSERNELTVSIHNGKFAVTWRSTTRMFQRGEARHPMFGPLPPERLQRVPGGAAWTGEKKIGEIDCREVSLDLPEAERQTLLLGMGVDTKLPAKKAKIELAVGIQDGRIHRQLLTLEQHQSSHRFEFLFGYTSPAEFEAPKEASELFALLEAPAIDVLKGVLEAFAKSNEAGWDLKGSFGGERSTPLPGSLKLTGVHQAPHLQLSMRFQGEKTEVVELYSDGVRAASRNEGAPSWDGKTRQSLGRLLSGDLLKSMTAGANWQKQDRTGKVAQLRPEAAVVETLFRDCGLPESAKVEETEIQIYVPRATGAIARIRVYALLSMEGSHNASAELNLYLKPNQEARVAVPEDAAKELNRK